MYTRIKAIVERPGGLSAVEVFGYATKGVPGLQVIGLGSSANATKEKFLYLSKVHNLKIPARKYVICIEDKGRGDFKANERQWLELPCLILFWSLADQLPIKKLDDCFCGGRISSCGEVESLSVNGNQLLNLHQSFPRKDRVIKYIGPASLILSDSIKLLALEGLFAKMQHLYYKKEFQQSISTLS